MKSKLSWLLIAVGACSALGCKDPPKKEDAKKSAPAPLPVKKKKSSVTALTSAYKPALPAEFKGDDAAQQDERITLGRMLYFDERLSKNHDISCNSCHQLEKYGVDGQKTSPGHKKQLGGRNSPTVYNAAGHMAQFWDGRSPHVEHQATQPVTNPVEMAMPDEAAVVAVLSSIPEYVELFKKAFPEADKPVTLENAGKAMGAFERKLVTPSRWDEFLKGKTGALTDEEQEGFRVFVTSGCSACHAGTLVGGSMYQKLGVVKPWPNQEDQGRFEVTKSEGDKMMFKVPSLRNIAETAPYFHDGSASTLEEAVAKMAEFQIARPVSEEDQKKIVTWLKSLTGELPTEYIKKPELPASTPQTPKPDPT